MEEDRVNLIGIDVDALVNNWGWILAFGIALLVLGIAAIAMPFIATLAATSLLALVFVIVGVVSTVHAFRSKKWSR